MLRALRQVDVFTTTPYHGNPVAVVLEGDGLTTEQMQRFAHWMNLSETTPDGTIWVGGGTVTCIDGEVDL